MESALDESERGEGREGCVPLLRSVPRTYFRERESAGRLEDRPVTACLFEQVGTEETVGETVGQGLKWVAYFAWLPLHA